MQVASMKAKIAAIGDKVEYDAKIQAQVDAIKSGWLDGVGLDGGGLDDEMLCMDGLADGAAPHDHLALAVAGRDTTRWRRCCCGRAVCALTNQSWLPGRIR